MIMNEDLTAICSENSCEKLQEVLKADIPNKEEFNESNIQQAYNSIAESLERVKRFKKERIEFMVKNEWFDLYFSKDELSAKQQNEFNQIQLSIEAEYITIGKLVVNINEMENGG